MVQLMSDFLITKKSLVNWAISSDHLASPWLLALEQRY
jgi:hypothetical protein